MARRGKKYVNIKKDRPMETLSLSEGIESVKKLSYSSFKGSIELHLLMNLPKDTDPKSLKGSVSLPYSTSDKNVRIAVFTTPDKQEVAKAAGADLYDLDQLMKDVKEGNVDFDVAIASPDVMPQIAVLGKELGPRGLMPNPKTGTVTEDIAKAVEEYKKGKMNFKSDDTGGMHFTVGNVEMETEQLLENITTCVAAAAEVIGRPVRQAVKLAHLAPTMGPSVKVQFVVEE